MRLFRWRKRVRCPPNLSSALFSAEGGLREQARSRTPGHRRALPGVDNERFVYGVPVINLLLIEPMPIFEHPPRDAIHC
jgi:hypothetical protein